MRKHKAFTLAEVLLVLAIIGVIAAITIPVTMQQAAEKKYTTLAKKTISTLQNAIDTKLTYVPTNPTNHENNVILWLINGEEFGHNTLKVVKSRVSRVEAGIITHVQTPDGIIIESGPARGAIAGEGANGKLGNRRYYFFVDLNGAEGPTRSTVEDGIGVGNPNREYDVIFFSLNNDSTVEFNRNWTSRTGGDNLEERTARGRKYLGYK